MSPFMQAGPPPEKALHTHALLPCAHPSGLGGHNSLTWQASPFMQADKIKRPLLLIHGEEDNNTGTFPMQSERFFAALKARACVCVTVRRVWEGGLCSQRRLRSVPWNEQFEAVLPWRDCLFSIRCLLWCPCHLLQGHGAVTRLVVLPKESHGYNARESVMHTLYEMDSWMSKYCISSSADAQE
jgi:hypothetical protein